MAKKFYVVWQGREQGIFTDWNTCKQQVDGFPGARYKSFPSIEEAEIAFGRKPVLQKTTKQTKPATVQRKTVSKGSLTCEQVTALDVTTKIFTDGGCDPNPGKAGSGLALYRNNVLCELWYGLFNPMGTNNTAELNALNQALLLAEQALARGETVAIFCDSRYSIQCITEWAVTWQRKGWKKAGGEIKNLELIQHMFSHYQKIKDRIKILHVNGHVGIEGNELADRMSIFAIESQASEFCLYPQPYDLTEVLAMRAG